MTVTSLFVPSLWKTQVISDNAGSILADPEPAAVLKPVQVARIRTAFAAKGKDLTADAMPLVAE